MILDQNGQPVEDKPKTHKFGQFIVPEGCHIKGFDSIRPEDGYPWTGTGGNGHKEHLKVRCHGGEQ